MTAYLNGIVLGSAQGTSKGQSGVDIQQGNYTFTVDMLRERDNGEYEYLILTII
jgi:hypothetical protein